MVGLANVCWLNFLTSDKKQRTAASLNFSMACFQMGQTQLNHLLCDCCVHKETDHSYQVNKCEICWNVCCSWTWTKHCWSTGSRNTLYSDSFYICTLNWWHSFYDCCVQTQTICIIYYSWAGCTKRSSEKHNSLLQRNIKKVLKSHLCCTDAFHPQVFST